jgi:hypothetical protein
MSGRKKPVEPWDGAFRAVVRNGCHMLYHGYLRATSSEAENDRTQVQGLGPDSWVEQFTGGQWHRV